MSNDVNSMSELGRVSDINKNDTLYVVHKPDSGELLNRKMTVGILSDYIFGSTEANEVDGNGILSVSDSSGNHKMIKVSNFEKRLFGTKQFLKDDLSNDSEFRIVVGSVRGTVKLKDFYSAIVTADTTVDTIDASKTKVKLSVDDTNASISIAKLDEYLTGKDSDKSIASGDTFVIVRADSGKKERVNFTNLVTSVFTTKRFLDAEIADSVKIITHSADTRGHVILGDLFEKFKNKLALPTYVVDDNVTANVTFLYKDGNKNGYMSKGMLSSIVLESNVGTLTNDMSLRAVKTNGDSFIVTYDSIKTDILNKVDSIYKVDPQHVSNINDGDGLIYIENGQDGPIYKNISYSTLKNKILNSDTVLTIAGNTKILLEGGHITYDALRDKIHRDFFGN